MSRDTHLPQLIQTDTQQAFYVPVLVSKRLFEQQSEQTREKKMPSQTPINEFLDQGSLIGVPLNRWHNA